VFTRCDPRSRPRRLSGEYRATHDEDFAADSEVPRSETVRRARGSRSDTLRDRSSFYLWPGGNKTAGTALARVGGR